MPAPKQKITLLRGDDYCALWSNNDQIFCYHGTITECLAAACKAIGVEFEVLDVDEDEYEWESVDHLTLQEFKGSLTQLRVRRKREELKKLKEQADQVQQEIKALES